MQIKCLNSYFHLLILTIRRIKYWFELREIAVVSFQLIKELTAP
jgi:hypothetical protein